MPETVDIGPFRVGAGEPALILAEAGVNHDGELDRARALVRAAAEAGADAVKFQTFSADRLVTRTAPQADYQVRGEGEVSTQHAMLKRLELTRADHVALVRQCVEVDLVFLSSPFDEASADLLDELEVPAFKLGSGELTNLPLLQHVARKGRPMILSTGMADLGEVEAALIAVRRAGDPPVVLLHCVSCYPAHPAEVNLRAMETLRGAFGVPVGYSDHTLGHEAALAAVALGACVIEKHFTVDCTLPGPDHQASIEPVELAALVASIRQVEMTLGHGRKVPLLREAEIAEVARKSLVAARDVAAGEVLDADAVAILRPGTGLAPAERDSVIGRTAAEAIPSGTPLTREMLR
jgi:N,N'-diacetyllegionaminate synthase